MLNVKRHVDATLALSKEIATRGARGETISVAEREFIDASTELFLFALIESSKPTEPPSKKMTFEEFMKGW